MTLALFVELLLLLLLRHTRCHRIKPLSAIDNVRSWLFQHRGVLSTNNAVRRVKITTRSQQIPTNVVACVKVTLLIIIQNQQLWKNSGCGFLRLFPGWAVCCTVVWCVVDILVQKRKCMLYLPGSPGGSKKTKTRKRAEKRGRHAIVFSICSVCSSHKLTWCFQPSTSRTTSVQADPLQLAT